MLISSPHIGVTLEVRLRRLGGHLNLPARMVLTDALLFDVFPAPEVFGNDTFAKGFIAWISES